MTHKSKLELRQADQEECWLGGMSPEEAFKWSVDNSTEAYAILAPSGATVAYWGWADQFIASGVCFAWMLSTPAMDQNKRWFARESKRLLSLLMESHWKIIIHVDPNYDLSIRWLEWMGFTRDGPAGSFLQMSFTKGGRA